jgi:type II secretory pathway component GspD/PulD (secretin)
MKTRLLSCLAALALAAGTAHAQTGESPLLAGGQGPRQAMRIDVDFDGEDLANVMEAIGRQVGRNILVDPNVRETVRVSLRDIPWREAVDVIARMTRCEVEERPGGILVLTQPPKVTIQFTDANVRTVLQLLAAYSGKNIIIAPDVAGQITLDLKEVHWLRALHAIVKTVGPFEVVEENDDLLRVVSRDSIEQQLETVVFPLRYVRPPANYRAVPPRQTGGAAGGAAATLFVGPATAQLSATDLDPATSFTLFRALRAVITASGIQGATMEYDRQTNSFVITATRPLLNQLKAIVDKLDLLPQQIFAEVKFVTTRDNNNQEYGIEFSDGQTTSGLVARGFFPQGRQVTTFQDVNTTVNAQGQVTSIAPVTRNVGEYPFTFGTGMDSFTEPFFLPAILDLRGLDMVLNMIDRDDRSRVIQSPSLFMLDNQDGVIFVGENVPYATVQSQPDANGNVVQTVQEGADSPVAIGFSLFVQPHIVPETDRIQLTVLPRVNDLTGTTSTITGFERFQFGNNVILDLPRTREQALVTHVMLDDTNTAVLGGLLTETDIEITKRVPILSSIPIIGSLFTNKQTQRRIENLTILITPTIVRDRSATNSIFHRSMRRLEETDYFYRTKEVPLGDDGNPDYDDAKEDK